MNVVGTNFDGHGIGGGDTIASHGASPMKPSNFTFMMHNEVIPSILYMFVSFHLYFLK